MHRKTAPLFKAAIQFEAAGEWDQAMNVYLEAAASGGKSGAEACLGAGRVSNRLGRFRDALGWLVKAWQETEQAAAIPPELKAKILLEMGTAQAGLGERARAIQSWQASLATHRIAEAARQLAAAQPANPEERILAVLHDGIRAQQAKNFKTAEDCFKEVLNWHPQHAQGTHLLGLVYFQTGRRDEARQLLEKSLQLQPNSAEFHNNYGMFLWERNDAAQAARFFQRATQINPNFAQAFNNLGLAYKKLGDLAQAEIAFLAALRLNEKFLEAKINLGMVRYEQKDQAGALRLLKEALALQPRFAALAETIRKMEQDKPAPRKSKGAKATGPAGTIKKSAPRAVKPKAASSPQAAVPKKAASAPGRKAAPSEKAAAKPEGGSARGQLSSPKSKQTAKPKAKRSS